MIKKKNTQEILIKSSTHFPSSVREWKNSIYSYNKNSINLIASTTVYAMNIIKSYFSLFNKKLERKMRAKRLLLRLRRLSSNRIYVSKGEFKHTNNKVCINIYIYNRQKYNYISKLKKIFLYRIYFEKKSINRNIIRRLKLIQAKSLKQVKESNSKKYLIINSLNNLKNKKINILKSLSPYISDFHNNILKLSMKKVRMYFLYKQLLFINKSKLSYTYLHLLKRFLEKLYNKNVEFNLINLKRFYLNSDIFSDTIRFKLTRNRRKLLKVFNRAKNKIKIHKKSFFLDNMKTNSLSLKDLRNKKNIINNIINNLKYRHVTGFRLEAKGRLTRRYTASRAISKLRYKGNLLNIDSSYRGLSSIMLKGNLKSNVQFTKIRSKTRIGSFGLKG